MHDHDFFNPENMLHSVPLFDTKNDGYHMQLIIYTYNKCAYHMPAQLLHAIVMYTNDYC